MDLRTIPTIYCTVLYIKKEKGRKRKEKGKKGVVLHHQLEGKAHPRWKELVIYIYIYIHEEQQNMPTIWLGKWCQQDPKYKAVKEQQKEGQQN